MIYQHVTRVWSIHTENGNLECKDIIKQACIYKYTAKVYTEIEEKIGRSRRRKKYQLS